MKILIILLASVSVVMGQSFTFHDQAWLGELASKGLITTPVDSFIDFHFDSADNGTNLSRNSLGASAYGVTNWFFNPSGGNLNFKLLARVAGSNETFLTPITVGGNTFTTTGTNWLRENYQIGATNQPDALQINFTGSSICEAQWYFKWSSITNSTNDINLDFYAFYDAPFGLPEIHIPGFTTNTTPNVYIHGQTTGGGSLTGPGATLSSGTNYLADLVWYSAPGQTNLSMAYVKLFNADAANAYVWGSCSYLLESNSLQDQFKRWAGYINLGTNSGAGLYGYIDTSPTWLNYSHVNTNGIPFFPVAPSSVTAFQSGSGIMTIGWVDNNLQLNPYQVDLTTNGGSTWQVNVTNTWQNPQFGITSNLMVFGLTTGMTYQTRVSAMFPPASRLSSYAFSGNVTLTNVSSSFITGGTNGLAGQLTTTNGFVFSPLANMTITDVGMFAYDSVFFPDNTVQVILTDASCNILAITNVDVSAHDGAFHYTTLGAPIALTSGTHYKIGFWNVNGRNFYFNSTPAHTSDATLVEDWAASSGNCNDCIECNATINYGANFEYTVP